MCTVTFIARKNGFALGMNRDEQLTRAPARPPQVWRLAGRRALYPSEPGGGTWVGVNEAGTGLALINWYAIAARVTGATVSRGEVVKAALAVDTVMAAEQILAGLPLKRMNAFRLIGFFPVNREVVEWRWNLKRLTARRHAWETNIWISSGFDEPGAQRLRGKTFGDACRQVSAGSLSWLRRLHRSHRPASGPYAICMHRAEAATVSYSEIVLTPSAATMRYHGGAPCSGAAFSLHQLKRRS